MKVKDLFENYSVNSQSPDSRDWQQLPDESKKYALLELRAFLRRKLYPNMPKETLNSLMDWFITDVDKSKIFDIWEENPDTDPAFGDFVPAKPVLMPERVKKMVDEWREIRASKRKIR